MPEPMTPEEAIIADAPIAPVGADNPVEPQPASPLPREPGTKYVLVPVPGFSKAQQAYLDELGGLDAENEESGLRSNLRKRTAQAMLNFAAAQVHEESELEILTSPPEGYVNLDENVMVARDTPAAAEELEPIKAWLDFGSMLLSARERLFDPNQPPALVFTTEQREAMMKAMKFLPQMLGFKDAKAMQSHPNGQAVCEALNTLASAPGLATEP